MSKLSTAIRLIKKKHDEVPAALLRNFSFLIPCDKLYLRLMFRFCMGYWPNFDNPKTFNEKIQWLKLYNRNPLYTTLVDKYSVKQYVSDKIGKEYIIPTIGVWSDAREINFDQLPNQFVLKTTNGGGGDVVICKDKRLLDQTLVIKQLNKWLKNNIYRKCREWPYKNVKPQIIAETYMEDESGELRDYKFFCFDGKVQALFIATERQNPNEDTKFDFFDRDFKHLPFTNGHPNACFLPQKPRMFEKMIELAERLSKGFPHIRIDLYEVGSQIYFGEMTFFHWSGMVPFNPESWDYKFGEWIQLSSKHF